MLTLKVALPGGETRRLRVDLNPTLTSIYALLKLPQTPARRLRWAVGGPAGVDLSTDAELAAACDAARAAGGDMLLVVDAGAAATANAAQREGREPPPLIGHIAGDHHRRYYQQMHKVPQGHRHPPFTGAAVVPTSAGPVEQPTLEVSPSLRERFTGESIHFSVNGEPCSVGPTVNPRTSLVDYLRDTLKLTGTKIGCGEGGCGACTVTLIRPGPRGKETVAANACLTPLCSLDGVAVTTIEGIGSEKKGYHKLQSELAKCDGSQCGYCSPGMVMNMYSFLAAQAADPSEAPPGNATALDAAVENRLQGNICRCTGYRSIYEAFRGAAAAEAAAVAEEEEQQGQCTAATPSAVMPAAAASTGSGCCSVLGHAAPQDPDSALWFNPMSLSDVVRKRAFLGHLYIKCIILPRQARDKHRENSKKSPFSRSGRC
jgi:aerobic-type carbon monoxide dehydrogenase small subunit (CoxS/CutS family)